MARVYCNKVRRTVRLVLHPAEEQGEVTCLGYEDGCETSEVMCPLTGETALEMGRRFARTELARQRIPQTRLA